MDRLIVSRHPAAVEFIAKQLGGIVSPSGLLVEFAAGEPVRVLPSASPEQVRGREVYGNLPLHLAACAATVWAIEFAGAPPRGQEYDLAAMEAAGARLVPYRVLDAAGMVALREAARGDGYGPHPYCLLPLPGEQNPYGG